MIDAPGPRPVDEPAERDRLRPYGPAMLRMLLRLEWHTDCAKGVIGICPACGGYEEVGYGGGGHREGCGLAALLDPLR